MLYIMGALAFLGWGALLDIKEKIKEKNKEYECNMSGIIKYIKTDLICPAREYVLNLNHKKSLEETIK